MFKWNVDGFALGKLGELGIGGVLRDEIGSVLCIFLVYIGVGDLNEVELFVIIFAFEIIVSRIFMGNNLIVESDFKNIVIWVLDKDKCFWYLGFLRNKMNNL